MSYQSLCDKFSQTATISAALVTGGIISTGIDAVFHTVGPSKALSLGFSAGAFGWFCGSIIHGAIYANLSFNDVDVSRGSRILKKAQMTAYAVSLAGILALYHTGNEPPAQPDSPPTSVMKSTAPPAPAVQTLPAPKLS